MSSLAVATPTEAAPPRPTAVVGIVGGGQLARLTHQAAIALGVEVVVLDAQADCPAGLAGATVRIGDADDLPALMALAARCDVVTLDHERTPIRHLIALWEEGHAVRPGPWAAALSRDRVKARQVLAARGLPVARFVVVAAGDTDACTRFGAEVGWPLVVKDPRGGDDGRGARVVEHERDLGALAVGAGDGGTWLVEAFVPIAREITVVIGRRPSGPPVVYPIVGTTQLDGTCHEVEMPARLTPAVEQAARQLALQVADAIEVVGTCAVELFVTEEGELVLDEIATRPHTSGHVSIDACATSQFENHLRAVLDWPLGDPQLLAPSAVTINVFASARPLDLSRRLPLALAPRGVSVHLYGTEHRPGRRIGHVTALADDPGTARDRACEAVRALVAP